MTGIDRHREAVEQRLRRVLALHAHPQNGAPFWIEKSAQLGMDLATEIRHIDDLHRIGFMDQSALRNRPLADFVPRSIWEKRNDLVIVQTGGTLGEPIWTAYTPQEYEAAFVTPFVVAARHVDFPSGGAWLYVGPTGPHVIGKAARSIAMATGAREPFTVDFDSRWARRLPAGSFAARRYLAHVVDQALDICHRQSVTHLFSTPPVLGQIAERLAPERRQRIVGVHYGGMSIEPAQMEDIRTRGFPRAVHLAGYGNTLFGCCLEVEFSKGREPHYFPHGQRLLFGACADPRDASSIDYARTNHRGRCTFTRLDETMLIVNMLERDEVTIVPPPAHAPTGFESNGTAAPKPSAQQPTPTAQALY